MLIHFNLFLFLPTRMMITKHVAIFKEIFVHEDSTGLILSPSHVFMFSGHT